jgi:hypothetical protein
MISVDVSSKRGPVLYLSAIITVILICGVVAHSNVVTYTWITNSDQLTLPFLARDLAKDPASWNAWQLSRAPYLFPDLVLAYIGYISTHALPLALQLSLGLFYALQLLALALLVRLVCPNDRAQSLLFAVLIWFLVPASLIAPYPDVTSNVIKYQFSIGTHLSALVVGALTFAVAAHAISIPQLGVMRARLLLFCLFALTLSGVVSNKIFYLYGVVPVGALVAYAALQNRQYKVPLKILLSLLLAISFARLLDMQLNRQPDIPLPLDLRAILTNARVFGGHVVMQFAEGSTPLRIWLLGSFLYVFGAPVFLHGLNRNSGKDELGDSARILRLLAIAFWTGSACSLLGTVLAYAETPAWRYLVGFFYYPLLHLALYVARELPKLCSRDGLRRNIAAAIAGVMLVTQGISLAIAASKSTNDVHRGFEHRANGLMDCVREHGLHAGVSSYWESKHLMFFAHNPVPVLPLPPGNPGAGLFYWGTNAQNFLTDPNNKPITYDFLLLDGFERGEILRSYGKPSREIACQKGMIVFAYDDTDSFYGKLIEGHAEIFVAPFRGAATASIPAAAMLSQVGTRSGTHRRAAGPSDKSGYMIFGPYIPLKKGSYRVVVQYAFEPSPSAVSQTANHMDVSADRGRATFAKAAMTEEQGAHMLVVPFVLKRNVGDAEIRVWFSGKGRLVVCSIELFQLGPNTNSLSDSINDTATSCGKS